MTVDTCLLEKKKFMIIYQTQYQYLILSIKTILFNFPISTYFESSNNFNPYYYIYLNFMAKCKI